MKNSIKLTFLFFSILVACFAMRLLYSNEKNAEAEKVESLIMQLQEQTIPHDFSHIKNNEQVEKEIIAIGIPAIKPLLKALYSKKNIIAERAPYLIQSIGDRSAVPGLIQALHNKEVRSSRSAIIEVLAILGGKDAYNELTDLVNKKDMDADTAAQSLYNFPNEKTIAFLIQIVDNKINKGNLVSEVQKGATRALLTLLPVSYDPIYGSESLLDDKAWPLVICKLRLWYDINGRFIKCVQNNAKKRKGWGRPNQVFVVDKESKLLETEYEKTAKMNAKEKTKLIAQKLGITLLEWNRKTVKEKNSAIEKAIMAIELKEEKHIKRMAYKKIVPHLIIKDD